MSSKYPNEFDLFETKQNATSQQDEAGDYVMAEDINGIQDAVSATQTVLGKKPQGNYPTVSERIGQLEGMQSLRTPTVLVYLGRLPLINGATSNDDVANQIAKFDHVIVGNDAQNPSSLDNNNVKLIIQKTKAIKNTKFYGYIDCSILTETLSEIQIKINQWIALGINGIYCDKIGYDYQVSRARQNQILDSIHQYSLTAIVNATNPDDIFSDIFETTLNPNRVLPTIKAGDVYHFNNFAVNTALAEKYTAIATTYAKIDKLLDYRVSLGIKIFTTATVDSSTTQATAQGYFDYAHAFAILSSVDGFYASETGYSTTSGVAKFYDQPALIGQWYTKDPLIKVSTGVYSRETGFGKITVDSNTHTYQYSGASIPTDMLRIIANSLDGSVLKEGSIADSKITGYSGSRLIGAINGSTSVIDIARVQGLTDGTGGISQGLLQANVIQAINANIGSVTIQAAKIADLNASKITAGTINADRISGSVIGAINLYAATMLVGDAKIGSAVIGTLSADHIKAAVIEAINFNAQGANIENLNADKITAGNISADRMRANIVNAINIYAQTMDVNSARINSGAIGVLSADHMQAAVITAINASVESADINKAKIGQLDASNLEANAVTAGKIAANAITAREILAGTITAMQIAAHVITADQIAAGAITATELAANSVTADKILAGTITASKIAAHVITANEIAADTITASEIAANAITASELSADSVIAGKIAANAVTAVTIAADAIIAGKIAADAITTRELAVDAVQAENILAGSITTNKIYAGAVTANQIAANTITAGQIAANTITASQIAADTITAAQIAANAITANELAANAVVAGKIAADAITSGTIQAGAITTDHMIAGTISGDRITVATLNGDRVIARTLDAKKIIAGSISAIEISAGAIVAKHISSGSVTADAISVGSISAEHITTVGLDAQLLNVYNSQTGQTLVGSGFLRVDGLDVGVVQSDNLIANGLFMTTSSSFGYIRNNVAGEALVGVTEPVGGSKVYKYNLSNLTAPPATINIPGKKPAYIAVDTEVNSLGDLGTFAYVTVQGDDTLVQIDVVNNVLTDKKLKLGKGPGRIKWTGDTLTDHKHFFALNTDPKDVNAPDSFMVIDVPPHSVDANLYVHHRIPLGNTPYDFVLSSNKYSYVTLADQGDIIVIKQQDGVSAKWKTVGAISIAPYGTDNYHGGLDADYGLGYAIGGSWVNQYTTGMGDMAGMHAHGGYSAATGSLITYKPHGIALSTDESLLFVADNANGHLVVVDPFRWFNHLAVIGSGTGAPHVHAMVADNGLGSDPYTMGGNASNNSNHVKYRIHIGDAPEFICVKSGKIFITLAGSEQIAIIDESQVMMDGKDQTTIPVRYVMNGTTNIVGNKPHDITCVPTMGTQGHLFVSLNGDNAIAEIDVATETVVRIIQAGANTMGLAVTADGKYMYAVNNGGAGSLSFIYPQGPYIGDAYLGLEGGVEFQGADFWAPNRSNWTYDVNGNIKSYAVVEFRINEPFLNEGGYTRFAMAGTDTQYAQIEQDIFNVTNYSDGNNTKDVLKEILRAVGTLNTTFQPRNEWINAPVPTIKIVSLDTDKNRIEVIPDPSTYTITYNTGAKIVFSSNTAVPVGGWIESNYTFRNNAWYKSHNGSVLIAMENSSSPNFSTVFEIDEFVPKFVTFDNQQTAPFTPVADGINEQYTGIEYSTMTNRAAGKTITSSVVPTTGVLSSIVDGTEIDAIDGDHTLEPLPAYNSPVTLPSGLQSVKIDLGTVYMIGKISVSHAYGMDRKYHNTKTEVSEDGVTWTTVYDSAVSGEYNEKMTYHSLHGHTHYAKFITFNAKPTRYVRDWVNGWTSGDALTSGTTNDWTEIKVYGDWEVEYGYVYPVSSDKAGLQIATNGRCVVSTDISKAYVAVDTQIEFTTWWWMTYLVGPEFGSMTVEMPTMMNMSHFLFCDAPYVNKVAHRHVMSYHPSQMILEDTMMGIKAGKHRSVVRQNSGKIALDRFRFEDFQRYASSSKLIPSTAAANFIRYSMVASQAQHYVGQGAQTTEGPYDMPRKNKDGIVDYSVPIKYRTRIRSELNPQGGSIERGIAYVTSAIFETGKQYTHWRMSQAADTFPGSRIEAWNPSQPHKTGIQHFHLANGSVRGAKILPSAIMDYHVSPYAKIGEYKLDLNFPTHGHINKAILDSITGFGVSGTSTNIAREDHLHDSIYMRKDASGGITGDFTVTGNIIVTGNVDGVDISAFKSAYDTHVADNNIHFTAAERTKLTGISTSANQVLYVSNGVLSFDGINTTIYTHATGDGNLHVPATSTTNNAKVLKAGATAGSIAWGSVDWSELTGKPLAFTPPIATGSVLGGVKIGSNVTVDAAGLISVAAPYVHPTTAGNLHIPVGGISGNWLKWSAAGTATWADITWTDIGSKPTTFTPSTHTHSAADITDLSSYALTASGANIFTNTNTFTKFDGPGIKIQPSQAPAANTVLFQLLSTAGATLVTMDAEGDVVINANLQVTGTTTYAGTTSVAGDYSITGNLTVGGNATLGDTLTDQTTAKGDLRVEGTLKQIGKYDEVMRFPVYGIGGDPQFQTDDTTFQEIISHYWTFDTNGTSCLPAIPTSATRQYKLLVTYATTGSPSACTLDIVQYGTSTEITSIILPEVNGVATGLVRTFLSPAFTTMYSSHTSFRGRNNTASASLVIKYIEVIAYDVY